MDSAVKYFEIAILIKLHNRIFVTNILFLFFIFNYFRNCDLQSFHDTVWHPIFNYQHKIPSILVISSPTSLKTVP